MGASAVGASVFQSVNPLAWADKIMTPAFDDPAATPMRMLAASKGLLYGSSGHSSILQHDPRFAALFAQQCSIMVPENQLKLDKVKPTQDSYDFSGADYLVNFAQQNDIKFRGHTLVWYQSLPGWFYRNMNASNLKPFMLDYINTLVTRYAGKFQSWDVVNEILNPADNRPDGMRNSPYLKFIGPEYPEMAFHAAAAADPSAMLVWNENWLEEETPEGESKRVTMLQRLKDMKSRNVPIHGIGIQSHLIGDHAAAYVGPGFHRFLHEVNEMGFKIIISELDVSDQNLPADAGARDQAIANLYYSYLSAVLKHKNVIAVLTWGLSDKYTWLSSYKARPDKLPVRPLPFDGNMNPKPVWNAIARAFDEAPSR
jgi:endo-1,4-beta-xylanase